MEYGIAMSAIMICVHNALNDYDMV